MAAKQESPVVFTGLRGRDGSDTSSLDIPLDKAAECLNVDRYRVTFARKRGGAIASSISGSNLTGKVSAAWRHVPGALYTAAELWLVDDAATPVLARYSGGAWSNPTLKSNIATRPQDVIMVSFNGKNFILADTSANRVQVFDPAISTTALRYAGLSTSAAATVANTGAGTYAATLRYYKIAYTVKVSGAVVLRSELSASVSFTPSGAGTAARVTKPASISEGETDWEVYGAVADAGPYYLLGSTVVGTTTYDDSVNPSDYSGSTAAPTTGDNIPLASYKYGIADSARMLFAGGWETGTAQNRVFITRPLLSTSSSFYDDECAPLDSTVDLDEKDSGTITGFGGPIENQIVVFKDTQTWRLIPTGNVDQPYRRKPITKTIGCIRQQTVVKAEDEAGNPALYWLAEQGPYRLGANGLARLVWDIQDIWNTVNLAATTVTAHGIYHADKRQVWWWVATSSSNEPDTKIVFDVDLGRVVEAGKVRDGWFVHTGDSAAARCSLMFSSSIGASMGRTLVPYIGQSGGNTRFWKCDTTDTTDNGTAFAASVTYPPRHFGGLSRRCHVGNPVVLGSAGNHTFRLTLTKDYGAEARTSDITMQTTSDQATETRIAKRVEGGFQTDATAVALKIGDPAAVASGSWEIDAVLVPVEAREEV